MDIGNLIIGILIWVGVYVIVQRICECFEHCSISKHLGTHKDLWTDDIRKGE